MSTQHLQLAAGSGVVPDDGQHGDPLAGPAKFPPPAGPRPTRLAAIGLEPGSYLRRAILWRVFGQADIEESPSVTWLDRPLTAEAAVVGQIPNPPPWDRFLDWAGNRSVVVDIQAAALMAQAAGHDLRVAMVAGPAAPELLVMCNQENRTVHPRAPAVEVVAPPPIATGLVQGDRVHLYAGTGLNLGLLTLSVNDALDRFAASCRAIVWGRERTTRNPALVSCPTPAGGRVTLMDLQTVDRDPEPCGAEIPGVQILLSLLGQSPVCFGRFVTPYRHYPEFIEALQNLARRHARHAAMESIGRSVDGRDLWLFKLARRPGLPVLLLSNAVHPYEWGPIFGVLRYLRFLLERLEDGNGFEVEDLLENHQIWWVPSVCPDGYDNRCQQPSAINLNRNFPGGWEHAAPGTMHWGNYGSPHRMETVDPISLRGPHAASQPETRAMMALLDRPDGPVRTLVDFHETTGFHNFLHQFEDEKGLIADLAYHAELEEGVQLAFQNRFYETINKGFRCVEHSPEFVPSGVSAWLGYAVRRGVKGCVVEALGGDATHYRTVRRTEYAAQVVEQALAAERGRLWRNPWGEDREITLRLRRAPAEAAWTLYDAAGRPAEAGREQAPVALTRLVPAGGCLRLIYR
jgi:hypothetical protein